MEYFRKTIVTITLQCKSTVIQIKRAVNVFNVIINFENKLAMNWQSFNGDIDDDDVRILTTQYCLANVICFIFCESVSIKFLHFIEWQNENGN